MLINLSNPVSILIKIYSIVFAWKSTKDPYIHINFRICNISKILHINLQVQQKLKMDSYEDLDELSADIELLVNNAKAFYKPDSSEYKDANELWKLYSHTKQALENGEESLSYYLLSCWTFCKPG